MKRTTLILFGCGLLIGTILVWVRPYTGYMDADYYYAGAKTIFEGKGWMDYALWNYLSGPDRIPFPAFTYWMPGASLLAAFGMFVSGNSSLLAARLPFVFLFAITSPLTYLASYLLFSNKRWALLSGILVLASGYFLKFVTEPDGFAILFLCGLALIFYLSQERIHLKWYAPVILGWISGIIHLTRADGLIWLFLLGGLLIALRIIHRTPRIHLVLLDLFLLLAGYLVITGIWYSRNLFDFRSLYPPGTSRGLWLNTYDQIFSYPATQLTWTSWLAAGWTTILSIRLKAFLLNTLSVIAVNGLIVLVPGIFMGWRNLGLKTLKWFFLFAFGIYFVLITLVFPLAGMRGGLLHSLAIFQPFLWIVAPMGYSLLLDRLKLLKKGISLDENRLFLGVGILTTVISVYLVYSDLLAERVNQSKLWSQYQHLEAFLDMQFPRVDQPVIVNNPPAYYAATGRQSLIIPYGDESTILELARQFSARFLLLDENHIPQLNDLYQNPQADRNGFIFVSEMDGIQIYDLNPDEKIP